MCILNCVFLKIEEKKVHEQLKRRIIKNNNNNNNNLTTNFLYHFLSQFVK